MGKICDKCTEEFRGFGTTCAPCRKTKSPVSETSTQTSGQDMCTACNKKVFVMEKLSVDNLLFHSSCFRCAHCNGKLTAGKFARDKATGKFLCIPHFKESFKRTGKYDFVNLRDATADAVSSLPAAARSAACALPNVPRDAVGESTSLPAFSPTATPRSIEAN
eukprot:GEMP01052796.1.p1 GENE.GEMP01052796.1~~GEMP01052796.1.p1  ORF type:complete len:163 (+),score=30.98 GEMP01052796.1:108-596(+)